MITVKLFYIGITQYQLSGQQILQQVYFLETILLIFLSHSSVHFCPINTKTVKLNQL